MTEAHTVLTNIGLGVDALPLKQISLVVLMKNTDSTSFLELLAHVDYTEIWLQPPTLSRAKRLKKKYHT